MFRYDKNVCDKKIDTFSHRKREKIIFKEEYEMRINHNISALNTYNKMTVNQNKAKKNTEKLSSGLRINRAGDDAAGLAISEKMRGQIRGLEQAATNAQDGISLIQTAEGALNETHAILQRMRELSVQSANDTNTAEDRQQLQNEVDQLSNEITRIAKDTTFNNSNLLDGSFDGKFHIGANAGQNLSVNIGKMDSASLGTTGFVTLKDMVIVNGSGEELMIKFGNHTNGTSVYDADKKELTLELQRGIDINTQDVAILINNNPSLQEAGIFATGGSSTTVLVPNADVTKVNGQTIEVPTGISISSQEDASNAITALDTAINSVSAERAKMGAVQNRLEHTINNLSTSAENLTAAESRIRDVDMAKEMMEMTKNNILQQAAQSMLAQANWIVNTKLNNFFKGILTIFNWG